MSDVPLFKKDVLLKIPVVSVVVQLHTVSSRDGLETMTSKMDLEAVEFCAYLI